MTLCPVEVTKGKPHERHQITRVCELVMTYGTCCRMAELSRDTAMRPVPKSNFISAH